MVQRIYRLLISPWTYEAVVLAAICVCLLGSLMLPANLAFFSGIDDAPLFQWLPEAGSPAKTWWLYAIVAMVGLLGLITALCTADALIRAARQGNLLYRLYPQLIHIGVLLVMLGYLLTAWLGLRVDLPLAEGARAGLPGGYSIELLGVGADKEPMDYYDDWVAEFRLSKNGQEPLTRTLRPTAPVFHGGLGIFMKSVTIPKEGSGKERTALIRVARDPGAPWALAGGLFVALGAVLFWLSRGKPANRAVSLRI